MRIRDRQTIIAALSQNGFDNWQSPLDSPLLQRPSKRPCELPGAGRTAAVTLLLYPAHPNRDAATDINLVLTRRHRQLTQHAGQISLPGGRQDPGESLQTTAIRETLEEIGISIQPEDFLGQLRDVYILPSDFTVTPFVAWLDQPGEFRLAADEVDEIITVSLSTLLLPETQTSRTVQNSAGDSIKVPCYVPQGQIIWGATALIISELLARIKWVEK